MGYVYVFSRTSCIWRHTTQKTPINKGRAELRAQEPVVFYVESTIIGGDVVIAQDYGSPTVRSIGKPQPGVYVFPRQSIVPARQIVKRGKISTTMRSGCIEATASEAETRESMAQKLRLVLLKLLRLAAGISRRNG